MGKGIDLASTGFVVGTALGPTEDIETWLASGDALGGESVGEISYEAFTARLSRCRSVAASFGGPIGVFSAACVSGLCAVEQAAADLALGRARCMVVGAVDSLGCLMRGGFSSLQALALSGYLRPFDAESECDGIVIGEAACFLVLEPLAAATERGARVHGLLVIQRLFSDSLHLVSPDPSGEAMTRAIKSTLEDVALRPERIGCITASAVGSSAYDRMLSHALQGSLGGEQARIPITTFEPFVGHVLAAGGPLSKAHATMLIEAGAVHPAFPAEQVAPECRLRYTFPGKRLLHSPFVLTLIVGFGGQNGVCLVAAGEGLGRS